jgi:hypothetical protein
MTNRPTFSESLLRQGYCIVEDLLCESELKALRTEADFFRRLLGSQVLLDSGCVVGTCDVLFSLQYVQRFLIRFLNQEPFSASGSDADFDRSDGTSFAELRSSLVDPSASAVVVDLITSSIPKVLQGVLETKDLYFVRGSLLRNISC